MSNQEKYLAAFTEVFSVDEETAKKLKYRDVKAWDSIGHMDLISTLEDSFDIEMSSDDIIAFSSYEKGIEIMKTHGVDI